MQQIPSSNTNNMKNVILILTVSLLTLSSCEKEKWNPYYEPLLDSFSFTEKEMEVEVDGTTTSFFIYATKEDLLKTTDVGVDYTKSSAEINKHYKIPQKEFQGYGFSFPADQKKATFEVTVVPENITTPVVITFCHQNLFPNGNANPEKYIDTLRVKLIPVVKTQK